MTTPAHTHTAMSPPPGTPQPPAPDEATAPDADPPSAPDTAKAPTPDPGQPSWTANALVAALTAAVTVVGGALAALLVYEFNSIDDKFAAIDEKFAAVDARFVSLEADMDDKFDSLEAGQAEIARTLAALVAELNARAAVDAALAGRLLAPRPPSPSSPAAPSRRPMR